MSHYAQSMQPQVQPSTLAWTSAATTSQRHQYQQQQQPAQVVAPPPFAGAPPIPQGVNPQVWAAGSWQYNPAWATQPYNPPAPWAPGYGWGPPAVAQTSAQGAPVPSTAMATAAAAAAAAAAASPNHNPYKRIPKPPDPSYWDEPLSSNPLGLENMVPRGERRECVDGDIPPTPWIWNPPGLVHDKPDEELPVAADLAGYEARRASLENQLHRPSSRRTSEDKQRSVPSQRISPPLPSSHTSPSTSHRSRSASDHPGVYHNHRSPEHGPSPDRHRSATTSETHQRHQPQHQHQSQHRQPAKSSSVDALAETFTARLELQPTFSPGIVRTPGGYRTLSHNDSREEMTANSAHHDYATQGEQQRHIPSPGLDGRIPGLGRPRTSAGRHSSMPTLVPSPSSPSPPSSAAAAAAVSSSTSSAAVASLVDSFSGMSMTFVDEPASLSSSFPSGPVAAVRNAAASSSSRSQSDPTAFARGVAAYPPHQHLHQQVRSQSDSLGRSASLDTIAENTAERWSARETRSARSIPAPIVSNGLGWSSAGANATSFAASGTLPASAGPLTGGRGSRPSPPYHNPLPRPPEEVHNPATSAPLPPSRPPPPPGTWKLKVRRGFWNRRGDFLTRDGFIVYAPAEKAYPKELEHYPEDAYINETGDRIEYADRPELPESLPRHGRPPVQPYDVFLQYEYLA